MSDGVVVPREADGDFVSAMKAWFTVLNPVIVPRQITVTPTNPVVFYQVEDSWDLHLFLKEVEAIQVEAMEGVPMVAKQPAAGPYFTALRDAALGAGITVPIVTALTGRFENGGRRVQGSGDAPGILPAFRFDDVDLYASLEARLRSLRQEMRNPSLHGSIFSSAPGLAVGVEIDGCARLFVEPRLVRAPSSNSLPPIWRGVQAVVSFLALGLSMGLAAAEDQSGAEDQ